MFDGLSGIWILLWKRLYALKKETIIKYEEFHLVKFSKRSLALWDSKIFANAIDFLLPTANLYRVFKIFESRVCLFTAFLTELFVLWAEQEKRGHLFEPICRLRTRIIWFFPSRRYSSSSGSVSDYLVISFLHFNYILFTVLLSKVNSVNDRKSLADLVFDFKIWFLKIRFKLVCFLICVLCFFVWN